MQLMDFLLVSTLVYFIDMASAEGVVSRGMHDLKSCNCNPQLMPMHTIYQYNAGIIEVPRGHLTYRISWE